MIKKKMIVIIIIMITITTKVLEGNVERMTQIIKPTLKKPTLLQDSSDLTMDHGQARL